MPPLFRLAVSFAWVVASLVMSALHQCLMRVFYGHRTRLLPELFYTRCHVNDYLVENCSALTREPFCPPWWMEDGHAQTILPVFLPKPHMEYRRELLNLADGGVLAIDWAVTGSGHLSAASPVVFVLPGLSGAANDFKYLSLIAIEKGLRPVVFNKRGHGGCKIITPYLQRFGDSSDFKHVVTYVGGMYPDAALTVIGASAGSGLMTSYLGAEKDESHLQAAVAICSGYDAERLFTECIKPPYDFLLVQGLRNMVYANRDVLARAFDVAAALESRSVNELEERLYCRIHGYKDISAYWAENDAKRAMWHVAIPMLSITARDDPVCVEELINYQLFETNQNIMLALMEKGGHCGFIEEGLLSKWSERTAVEFLLSVLEYRRHRNNSSDMEADMSTVEKELLSQTFN